MSQVRCTSIGRGLRESEIVANVVDTNGRIHSIRVERDFLSHKDDADYLPVGIVQYNPKSGRVLVEFSHEPETGINRIWVDKSQLDVQIEEFA